MNKLLTKIVGAVLGAAMTVGVGVAVASQNNGGVQRAEATISSSYETISFASYTSSSSVSINNVAVSSDGDNFTLTAKKNNKETAPSYYKNGDAVRLYYGTGTNSGANTVTISSATKYIGKIEFTSASTTLLAASVNTGTYSKNEQGTLGTWTCANETTSSVVFTVTAASRFTVVKIYPISTATPVTITGSSTVAEGTPVTYSCDEGVTATWSLEDVLPAGCATISGSTVTAHQTGSATLVCTPSTSGYETSTLALTITASIKHNTIKAGSYFINAASGVPSIGNGSMLKPEEVAKSPVAIQPDFSDSSLAWSIEENDTADNGYNIKSGSLYLVCADDSEGISITTTAPGADKYWTITSHGSDSYGNTQYRFHYVDAGNRYMALYAGASSNSFRSYAYDSSHSNYDFNLIPVSRTLTALTVGGTLQYNSYDQGDVFNPAGASVKGTYTNGYGDTANAYIDVTSSVSWNPNKLDTAGSINVYAKINELQSTNYFTVTVTAIAVPVTGVTVSPASHTFSYVQIGTTQQLTETVSPENASNKSVTWSSSNEAVATVSSTGLVTAQGVGSAVITVTTTNGGFTATCNITVSQFEGDYNKITDESKIHDGMVLTFGNAAKQAVATSFGTYIEAAQNSATIVNGSLAANTVLEFTVKGKVNEWMLVDSDGNWLNQTAAAKNNLALDKTGANKYWTISIADGVATVANNGGEDYGALYFNSGSPRISNYQTQGTMALLEIYAKESEDNVLTFVKNNMRMGDTALTSEQDTGTCKSTGNDYYLTAKTALASLSGSERSAFENNTGSKYTEALKRYKAWASACGDKQPFNGGTSIVLSSRTSLLGSASDSANAAVIITIVSVISLSAVAGFFLLRKRKEQ